MASESRLWKSRKAKPASQLSHSLDYYDFLTRYGIHILRARSDQLDAYLMRAEIFEQLGDDTKAIENYDAAIAVMGECIPARVNKAVILFGMGVYEVALAEMNRVIELEETEPSHYENRAAIYSKLQRWDLAEHDQLRADSYQLRALNSLSENTI